MMMINRFIAEESGKDTPLVMYVPAGYFDKYSDVTITGDWHLWIKDRDSVVDGINPVFCRENIDDILQPYRNLAETDLLINLGDLVDDEFYLQFNVDEQKAIFHEMFDDIKCHKILIMGNNDSQQHITLYEECGFTVFDGLVFGDYVFTHHPINIRNFNGLFNIHGHNHGHGYYWRVPFVKHLDIWSSERKPIKFTELEERLEEYKPHIKDVYNLGMKTKDELTAFKGSYKEEY